MSVDIGVVHSLRWNDKGTFIQHCGFHQPIISQLLQLMKATMLTESSFIISMSTTPMSTDWVRQVSHSSLVFNLFFINTFKYHVFAPMGRFQLDFLSFHLSRFSFYINICTVINIFCNFTSNVKAFGQCLGFDTLLNNFHLLLSSSIKVRIKQSWNSLVKTFFPAYCQLELSSSKNILSRMLRDEVALCHHFYRHTHSLIMSGHVTLLCNHKNYFLFVLDL